MEVVNSQDGHRRGHWSSHKAEQISAQLEGMGVKRTNQGFCTFSRRQSGTRDSKFSAHTDSDRSNDCHRLRNHQRMERSGGPSHYRVGNGSADRRCHESRKAECFCLDVVVESEVHARERSLTERASVHSVDVAGAFRPKAEVVCQKRHKFTQSYGRETNTKDVASCEPSRGMEKREERCFDRTRTFWTGHTLDDVFFKSPQAGDSASIFELGMARKVSRQIRGSVSCPVVSRKQFEGRYEIRRRKFIQRHGTAAIWPEFVNERWPLHVARVCPIRKELFQVMEKQGGMSDVIEPLFSVKWYLQFLDITCRMHIPDSKLSPEEANAMLQAGLVLEVPHSCVSCCPGFLFKVPEAEKLRFRVVHHPFVWNAVLPEPPPLRFTTIAKVKNLVLKEFCAQFDFTKFYYQFRLSPAVAALFEFRVGERNFCMQRLPMGLKWACIVANKTTQFLVDLALQETKVNVSADVYIDNVKFASESEVQLKTVSRSFERICAYYDVTIGERSSAQESVYRGILYDHKRSQISISPRTLHKLQRRIPKSWAQWESSIGMMIHCMQILGMPMAKAFQLLVWFTKKQKCAESSREKRVRFHRRPSCVG